MDTTEAEQSAEHDDSTAGESATATEAEDTTEVVPDADADTEADAESDDIGEADGRREAKLRKRAQAAEAERDTLAEQVRTLQSRMVDRMIEDAGYKPAAFWKANDLAELAADDGTIDTERVHAAIAHTAEELGLRNGRLPAPNPAQGMSANGFPPVSADERWAQAFKRR